MRKALVPFLVLGLLLLGVSPVMAAGEQVKAALPVQQDEVVQVVVPEGEALDDVYLSSEVGGNPALAVLAVVAARVAVRWAVRFAVNRVKGAVIGAAWEVGSQAVRTARDRRNRFDARTIGCAAVGGAVAGGGRSFARAAAASFAGGAAAAYCNR